VGRETHPWAPEAEREADWAAAPNFQRRVEVREGRCLPGECLFISAAPPPRVPPPRVPPAQWVLARGLAVRSGGAGGSASLPRGGPHGGGSMLGILIRRIPGSGAKCRTPNGGFG
jgi:hypothetical protein